MGTEMKYTVLIEKGPNNYGAYIRDLPGCVAVADTKEEVIALIQEGIVYHLEFMHEERRPHTRAEHDRDSGGSMSSLAMTYTD